MQQRATPHWPTYGGAIAALVLMIVGSVGPWGHVSVFGSSFTLNGLDRDGSLILGLAVIAAVFLLVHWLAGLPIWTTIVDLVIGILSVLILIIDTADIGRLSSTSISWGIVVALVGAVSFSATALMLTLQARGRRAIAPSVAVLPGLQQPGAYSPAPPGPAPGAYAPAPPGPVPGVSPPAVAGLPPSAPAPPVAAPTVVAPQPAAAPSPAAASPPANWYPDPSGQARLRYWDGARWTEHTA